MQQMIRISLVVVIFSLAPPEKEICPHVRARFSLQTSLINQIGTEIPLSDIASEHALENIREDLRSRVRSVHVIATQFRVLRVHQNCRVVGLALSVHVRSGSSICARESRNVAAPLANPAEPQQINGSQLALAR